jgi:hypothetical protein
MRKALATEKAPTCVGIGSDCRVEIDAVAVKPR